MKQFKPFLAILGIYVLIQGAGLFISHTGPEGKGIVETVKEGELQGAVQNPESTDSSLQLFLYVIVSTAALLILLKYRFDFVITILIYFSLLGGMILTGFGLLGSIGVLLAIVFFIVGLFFRKHLWAQNLFVSAAVPGIGSWLGASLAFTPALVFLLIIAAYDLVAVFGTKHMVKIAERVKGNLPLMVGVPVGDRVLGLGTGDLAIPLVFTVSVLRDYTLEQALFTGVGGLIGITALFVYISRKKDVVLPALPPIAAGLIIGYGIGLLI